MFNFLGIVPVIIPHSSSAPSCACFYEHRYGIECLCECHSFEAQFSSFICALSFAILLLVVFHLFTRLMFKVLTSFY